MNAPDGRNGQNVRGEPAAKPEGRGAMNSDAAGRIYGQHSGYRKLKAYQVAELLYDFTCRFCDRYIPFKDRHHDQMVQAARSGYQNIAEGSEDSATSKKLEMNLTNVARSSIDEVRKDYLKYLTRRNLPVWEEGHALFDEARTLRPRNLEQAAAWVNRRRAGSTSEERAANMGAILATQAHWLTERLLDRQARDFETEGGFSERLHRARKAAGGGWKPPARADGKNGTDKTGGTGATAGRASPSVPSVKSVQSVKGGRTTGARKRTE